MKNKSLTPREKQFCRFFAITGNPREAAFRAGYKLFPERAGLKVLEKKEARVEIDRMKKVYEACAGEAAIGLKRVAFGSVSDPVKLIFSDELSDEQIEALDLFNVSEIKRPKNGGLEIKFFDRVRALERLAELNVSGCESPVSPFYDALVKGARMLSSNERGDDR